LPHIAHHLQHEVPVPQPDKNLGQPAIGLQQNGPTGAGAKVSLELTPIDSVTLSDGYYPGERAQCRRSERRPERDRMTHPTRRSG
jgi:hypothetical protein